VASASVLTPALSHRTAVSSLQSSSIERDNERLGALTNREQQVVALVCQGHPNKLVARSLNLAEGTVKCHLHTVFQKLDVSSRTALILKLSNQ
jgi:two-component system, NarL family, nitrate/nitrite response regulator NarL